MTTNGLQRIRSKSISDVFTALEIEEDKEDLLPGQLPATTMRSKLEKWKSSLTLNLQKNEQTLQNQRKPRANSIFSRPPLPPNSRRQSLAEVFRRPVGLKEDIKKFWDRRPSLNGLKKHLKMGQNRSEDNLHTDRPVPYFQCDPTVERLSKNDLALHAFFIVDNSPWKYG